jgi:3-oxoacyl-(acyl-carrier-protein) reductase
MKKLEGQVALVTGGNAGIGRAIVIKLAEQGAKVAIFGTDVQRGAQVVQEVAELTGADGNAMFYQVNVADHQEVEGAVKKFLESWGRVDIVINNAGITRDQLLMRMTEEDWDQVMAINTKSCYNVCHAVVRPMMKARKGKIVYISSVVGLTGNVGQANYAASKAAGIGFSKALAKELAPRNICVNCIAPGYIETRMTAELDEEQKKSLLSSIPLGRMGMPEEIANAALFLAGPDSDYITGQVLVVDGGMVI